MTEYSVQFELPCEDPVNSVRMERRKRVIHFFVPINHPTAHNFGLADLLAAVERRELLTVSTGLNNTVCVLPKIHYYAEGGTIKRNAVGMAKSENAADEGTQEVPAQSVQSGSA